MLLVTGVTSEGTCRGKFAKFVTDHVLSNVNRYEFITVMNCYSMSDKVG